MKNLFSLAHLTVLGCNPLEMIAIAARTGYDFVSLRLMQMGVPGEGIGLMEDQTMIQKTKALLRETGVRLLDIEVAMIAKDKDPEYYLPAMETAAELGAHHVVSSAWTKDENDRDFIVDRFAELCDQAKPFGLTVDLEFPSFSRLTNLIDTADIVRTANRENGGILIDTLYLHFSKARLEALDEMPKNWFHFLHLCDTSCEIPSTTDVMKTISREGRLYAGEGCIDFNSILKHLPNIPYSIEIPNIKRVKEFGYEEHARRCLETAKEVLKP